MTLSFSLGDVITLATVTIGLWAAYLRARKLQKQIDQIPVSAELTAAAKNVDAANKNVEASNELVANLRIEVSRYREQTIGCMAQMDMLISQHAKDVTSIKMDHSKKIEGLRAEYEEKVANLELKLQQEQVAREDGNHRNALVIADLSIKNDQNERLIQQLTEKNAQTDQQLKVMVSRNSELEKEIEKLRQSNERK